MAYKTTALLDVRNLYQSFVQPVSWLERRFGATDRVVQAVNGVTFKIMPGEVFSLVGESGCGKSTTARTIVRLLTPVSGEIYFEGKEIGRLTPAQLMPFRKKMQMVFQNPYASLDPRQKVGDIIMEPLLFHGIANSREDAVDRMLYLMDAVGLQSDQADRYPHQFSGGQRQRVGIMRALTTNPKLIIADEPVSALDVSVQAQILNLLMDIRDKIDLSYLFIAHDLSVVRHVTDRLAIMYLGLIVEQGTRDEIFDMPLHPYTKALLGAAPSLDKKLTEAPLQGEVPSPINIPRGCVFSTRCPFQQDICLRERPLLNKNGGHESACHFAGIV